MRVYGNVFGPSTKYYEPAKLYRDDRLLQCKKCLCLFDIAQLRVVSGSWICMDCKAIHDTGEVYVKDFKTTKWQIPS